MADFNTFVQTELPLRPFVATDGAVGQILVRSANPAHPREMVWAANNGAGGSGSGNLDGGRADEVYTMAQVADGGGAAG